MRKTVAHQQFDAERALYNLCSADVTDCTFAGPADGESVLKEARDVVLANCSFSLRYPLWHVDTFRLDGCTMDEKTRAAIWYCQNGQIRNCDLGGIKAVRECRSIHIFDSTIVSQEFGWKCSDITLTDSSITAEYLFFDSRDVHLDRVNMKGKYSFQYMENLTVRDSYLDTKDAFWHSKNVTAINCTLRGEYLAWFSQGLTLINCRIIGTQPLCYCQDLRLENCTMEQTDLSFEYSDVHADIIGHIDSVKNPRSGHIIADSIGQVITGDTVMPCSGQVIIRHH